MQSAHAAPAAAESPALRGLGRVVSALASLAMAGAALCLLASFALIGWSVLMRYAFNAPPVWVDEVVGFALVAIVMLAAAQTLRRDEHIGVDLLVTSLPPAAKRWARAWAALATGLIAGVLIFNGWGTAQLARQLGLLTEGSLEWPTWWLMMLMPVGGTLLLLAAVEALWRPALGATPAHGEPGEEAEGAP
jgi:TRAP-type C4-dicarboxylate transport system permease small subunit